LETENAVADFMVSDGKPFMLALPCQPGFKYIAFHIMSRIKGI
jgi:hypothetical protein